MTESAYRQAPWSLADLFPTGSPQELEAAFNEIQGAVQSFERDVRPQLAEGISENDFNAIIARLEAILREMYHLSGYARLRFSANTQDQAAQALLARVSQFSADVQNNTLFFELWWKGLDEGAAQKLMSASGDYRYWLEEMRHFKPYTLSEPEEKVINIKDVTGVRAITRLYDSLTNRYVFKITVDGEQKEMTRGELMSLVRQNDPQVRAGAYQELFRVYGDDGPILGMMYQTLVRDWRNENVNLRGFSSPISVRNLANDIPDEVVRILLAKCQENAEIFQRYFNVKARWLGMQKLRRYDIYAPVAASSAKKYDFSAAAGMVLDSFQEFDPQFAALAQRVFDRQHLDSEVRKGKQGGAFCSTPDSKLTPWVLVNYQGQASDVAALAHELGHAIHSMLAAHHSLFTSHASLPLAETASTFGEMMLLDRLLQSETDESVRRDMLFRQVDDAYATIMRQAFFALFEQTAHEAILQGATADDLSKAYLANMAAQFGDALILPDEFRWEWVSIPHIYHTPFYVYAYSFGQLLVLSLFQQYQREGDSFKPRYRKILSTGGSEAPVSVLSDAGINIGDPAFWQGGFDVVKGLVSQLEQMPVKR